MGIFDTCMAHTATKSLILLLVLLPFVVVARTEDVIINEIAWMGSKIEGVDPRQWWRYEWLELFNTKDNPLRIHGWKIELSREKLDFSIPLKGTIPAKGYILVASSDKIQNADVIYGSLAGKFANSGQLVVLKDAQGQIVDSVDATSGWPAGNNKEKYTMERRAGTVPAWQTSLNVGGTPRAKNSMAPKLSFEQKLSFTRFSQKLSVENITSLVIAFLVAILSAVLAMFLKKRLHQRISLE